MFWLVYITMLALVIRLVLLYLDPLLDRDSILYIQMAQSWHDSGSYLGIFNTFREELIWIPPLSLYFIKTLMNVGLSAEVSARILALFFGLSIPLIGYFLTKIVCRNNTISLCATLFFAVNPVLVQYSIEPNREVFYLVLGGLSLLFICKGIRFQNWYNWFLSGVFSSLSCLTRYEGLELPIYVIIYFLVSVSILKQYDLVKAIRHIIFYYFGLVITLLLFSIMINTMHNLPWTYSQYLSRLQSQVF